MRALRNTFLGLVVAILLAGCDDDTLAIKWSFQKPKPEHDANYVEGGVDDLSRSRSYRDTVAEQGWLEGLRLMRVRGYGIVAGLGTRGSRECPQRVRDRLVQEMYKRPEFASVGIKPARVSPEQLIDDVDTAVVMIEGEIPAAASEGDTFDLFVRALPGTQTTSLEGGKLYTADLHVYRDVSSGGAIEGKTLATATGPIFVNPFAGEAGAVTQRNAREGFVIGGGMVVEPRRVRFVLSQPSYQRARRIADAINSRFPATPKVADAASPSYVSLRIPPSYRRDPFHFLALVRHLYLPQRQGFADKRAQELAEEVLRPTAPHPDIALAWEGIGRTVLPVVQKLYTDVRPHARFYAALAGFRLGDDVAVEVLAEFAKAPDSPYRLTAIEEFGRVTQSLRAAGVLRELLNAPDPRIRVEAYEALLARDDPAIESEAVADGAFFIDRVPSTAGNLIYVRRTGFPRIALFGAGLRCNPPVFYEDPNGMITINAPDDARTLTLIRRTPFGGAASPPLPGPFEIDKLISMLGDDPVVTSPTEVHGLALDYSTITHALYTLCTSRTVNAKFMLQTTTVTEMFGPLTSTGRKESDL